MPHTPENPPIINDTTTQKSKLGISGAWKGTLIAAVICIVAVSNRAKIVWEQMGFSERNVTKILAESLGSLIAIALIAATLALVIAGIMSLFKRRFVSSFIRGYSIGVVVLACLSLAGILLTKSRKESLTSRYDSLARIEDSSNERKQAKILTDEMKAEARKALTYDSRGNDDIQVKSVGKYGVLERFIKELTKEATEIRNEYDNELQDANFHSILDAERLQRDVNFEDSRMMIKAARSAINKNVKQLEAFMSTLDSRVDKLDLSDKEKASMKNGLDQGMGRGIRILQKQSNLEKECITTFEDIVDFLQSKKGQWSAANGELSFDRTTDMNIYNGYIEKIQDIVSKQEAVVHESVNQTERNLDRLHK